MLPLFRVDAGMNNGEIYELHAHFGSFVRLQIGNSNGPNYKNWYLISIYIPWRHVARIKKDGKTWIDDASLAQPNNNDWPN